MSAASDRAFLRQYADVISMWTAKYDSAEIAARLRIPEGIVAKWIAHFRDLRAAS